MASKVAVRHGETDLHKVVAYLLALIPESALQGKRAKIHRAFYEIAQAFPGLLPGLAFSSNSSDPYSKPLEQILFCLANAGLISNLNPTFKVMSMDEQAKQEIVREYEPGLAEISTQAREAAQILREKLSTASDYTPSDGGGKG